MILQQLTTQVKWNVLTIDDAADEAEPTRQQAFCVAHDENLMEEQNRILDRTTKNVQEQKKTADLLIKFHCYL